MRAKTPRVWRGEYGEGSVERGMWRGFVQTPHFP